MLHVAEGVKGTFLGMRRCKLACNEVCTQLCKTSNATTHLHLEGMFCIRARLFPFGVPTMNISFLLHKHLCLQLQTSQLQLKSGPTGLTGHRVNTAPLNSSWSQASHLQQSFQQVLEGFSQAEMTLKLCLSSQCLFVYWVVPQVPTVP